MNIGDRFTVLEQFEVRRGEKLLARYLPGLAYRVTDRNREIVEKAEVEGKVKPGGASSEVESGPMAAAAAGASTTGSFSTKPKEKG